MSVSNSKYFGTARYLHEAHQTKPIYRKFTKIKPFNTAKTRFICLCKLCYLWPRSLSSDVFFENHISISNYWLHNFRATSAAAAGVGDNFTP